MKLTIEEKAKAYDEAIERANELLYVSDKESLQYQTIKHILPELIESEGEKIRKELIQRVIHDGNGRYTYNKNDYITWLEKQGEHANFRSKIQVGDKVTRNEAGMLVNISQLNRIAKPAKKQDEQKPTWSEEDENNILFLTSIIEECFKDKEKITLCGDTVRVNFTKEDVIERLKSLRPQKQWKPSDGQMASITCAVRKMKESVCYDSELVSLFNDLKKLKGK